MPIDVQSVSNINIIWAHDAHTAAMLAYTYGSTVRALSRRSCFSTWYRSSCRTTTLFTTSTKPSTSSLGTKPSSVLEKIDTEDGIEAVHSDVDEEKLDKRVWPIAASNLMMGTAIGVLMPVMPLFAQEIGITTAELGAAVSVMGISRLLFNIPAAWAVDRYGRRPSMVGGPFISAMGMTYTALCTTANELIASRFATGLGGSISQAGSQSYLADISTVKNRARTMAPMGAAFSAGALVGPAIGGYLGESYGLHTPFYFIGGAILCVTINNYIMLPETKPPSLDTSEKTRSIKDEFLSTFRSWKPLLKNGDIMGVISVHTTYWMLLVGCQFTLMPLLAAERFDATPSMIGSVYALTSLINIVGSQPSAWLSDKYGRKKVMLPGIALICAGVGSMALAQDIQQFYASVVLWGIGGTSLGTAPMAYVADAADDKNRTQALALFRSGGDLGFVLGGVSWHNVPCLWYKCRLWKFFNTVSWSWFCVFGKRQRTRGNEIVKCF